jgi:hypothetical protein
MSTSARRLPSTVALPAAGDILYTLSLVATNTGVAYLSYRLGTTWLAALLVGVTVLLLVGVVSGRR